MILLNFDLTNLSSFVINLLPKKIPVVLVLEPGQEYSFDSVKPIQDSEYFVTAFKTVIQESGFEVKRTSSLFPTMALDVKPKDILELRKLNEVKEIWYDFTVYQTLDDSSKVDNIRQIRENYKVTGKGNTVYVLDTGMDLDHKSLVNSISGNKDFVNEDKWINPNKTHHSSHVGGIISSDHSTFKGIAPDTKLFSIKILNNDGSGSMSTIIQGIDSVFKLGGNLINLSVGGINPLCAGNCPVCQSINKAAEHNIISGVAAGNSGFLPYTLCCPGKAEKGLTIAAIDNNKQLAYWSSRSGFGNVKKPDFAAMGVNINSCSGDGGFIELSGTSMATPRVMGYISLLREYWSKRIPVEKFTPDIIKNILKESSDNGLMYNSGAGNINIEKCFKIIDQLKT